MSRYEFNIFTDGSYSTSESDRTYGGFIIEGLDVSLLAYTSNKTWTASRNVGGELLAVVLALKTVEEFKEQNPDSDVTVNFFYDYEGVGKWIKGEWQCKKPLTQGYKKFVQDSIRKLNLTVSWTHVKGHSGIKSNERVDSLVTRYDRRDIASCMDDLTKEIAK